MVKYCKGIITQSVYICQGFVTIIFMKALMFLVSLAGFAFSLYFLITDFPETFDTNDLIYLILLTLVLINSIVGLAITVPKSLLKKKGKLMFCDSYQYQK